MTARGHRIGPLHYVRNGLACPASLNTAVQVTPSRLSFVLLAACQYGDRLQEGALTTSNLSWTLMSI